MCDGTEREDTTFAISKATFVYVTAVSSLFFFSINFEEKRTYHVQPGGQILTLRFSSPLLGLVASTPPADRV